MFVEIHKPCPDQDNCGSTDAASRDENGTWVCFSCGFHFYPDGDAVNPDTKVRKRWSVPADDELGDDPVLAPEVKPEPKPQFSQLEHQLATGDYAGCPKRGITAETAKTYRAMHLPGRTLYGYYGKESATQPAAVKMRLPGKKFAWVGDAKAAGLFGQQLFSGGGKFVTITEGEEDAMAAYQLSGSKYPVVSVKNGASGALKDCKHSYDWLDTFETIVICFDSDEPGKTAAKEVAQLFGGKSKIMRHPEGVKDACDYYTQGKTAEYVTRFWRAEQYTPDGIVSGESLREKLKVPVPEPTLKYPWKGLNDMLRGIREPELVTVCAGSGTGKSSLLREVAFHILSTTDRSVGLAFLEEEPERTMRGVAGLGLGKPIHLDGVEYTPDEIDRVFDQHSLGERAHFWDHFGSTQIDNVISRLRYFIKAMGCSVVILDHISIVVSGDATQNERQTLDELMTRLRTEVVQECKCSLFIVSHLTRPDGKPLENGAQVSLSLLRGSGSIAQLSDVVIAAERDSQADSYVERNTLRIRVLKSRLVGKTGVATHLTYDEHTGRLTETDMDL